MSQYIVSLTTEYGPCGHYFPSPESKDVIEQNLEYCVENEKPWILKTLNGETIAQYNGITAYSVIECTPENRMR